MKISRKATIGFVLVASLSLGAEARLGKARGGDNANKRVNKRVLQLVELEGFGGDPSDNDLPLQLCQGDCDNDADVSNSGINKVEHIILCIHCPHIQHFHYPHEIHRINRH